jgi:minor tail protein Z (GPZ)
MITLTIKHNFPEVIRRLDTLREDIGRRALASAMNKTIAQGKTAMARAITKEYAIKAKEVREQITLERARAGREVLIASVAAFGRRRGHRSRNVMLFGAKQAHGRDRKRVRFKTPRGWVTRIVPIGGGVSVKIKRAEGRKLIAGAFIANKGRTVFMRVPGQGRKIRAVETIDVPQMFNTRHINERVVQLILAKFPAIFNHEAKFFINKFNGG